MEEIITGIDTLWVILGGILVFFMQAGFGMVEAGLVRAKNTVNILMKNFIDFFIATIFFYLCGYAFMFGEGNSIIGKSGFCLINAVNPSQVPLMAFVFFQTAFAGTAATIVSGAVAERMKFSSYVYFTIFMSAIIYPVVGHWIWGGGWLAEMGFADFAGSTVVHAIGGVGALAGAYVLGPRTGKYNVDCSSNIIAGHSIPLASLGIFILWFGWFGFNAASSLSIGDGKLISLIIMNTNLAAVAGGIASLAYVWIKFKKPDLSMTMNGVLGGLVAVTAPCAYISPWAALAIGLIGGLLVVKGVLFIDSIMIDDPVGAIAVHGINGIWGTIAVGIFGQRALGLVHNGLFYGGGFVQLGIQTIGAFCSVAFCFAAMLAFFKVLDYAVGIRVSKMEEYRGLDIGEHGLEAYGDFQIYLTK